MKTAEESATDVLEAADDSADIAESLERIANAAEHLCRAGLTERAILVLLKDKTGLGMGDLQCVLRALPRLKDYIRGGQSSHD